MSPPGPFAQSVNRLLHTEPYSFLFHGVFWSTVLIVVFPLAGCGLLVSSIVQLVWIGLGRGGVAARVRTEENRSWLLAVYVTGCDSGFGQDLAFALASRGFVVFAGCLTEQGWQQYQDVENISPLRVDVTRDADCVGAATAVRTWLDKASPTEPRFLHAVVNNAGIGAAGLIDWTPISNYQKTMDVNYYGTIRTTKAFLPILKAQIYSRTYQQARVVVVSSMAGLFAGNVGTSSYSGSKHAVEAFAACLRNELTMTFEHLRVVTINPSKHGTAMMRQTAPLLQPCWDNLDAKTRNDYGQEYFDSMLRAVANLKKATWDPKYVKNALISAIELVEPPPQIIVGLDAKCFTMVVRLLPMWAQAKVLTMLNSKAVPACMKDPS